MIKRTKFCLLLVSMLVWGPACESDVTNRVGTSTSGLIIAIKAFAGNAGLPSDGVSQATIRVEVFTSAGQVVDDAEVFLTTTLGTLGAATLLTTGGVATTTLTSSIIPGTAFISATVENVTATIAVQIVNISTSVIS